MNRDFLVDFVSDAGPETGLGHLSRCLSLSSSLRRKGMQTRLFIHGRNYRALDTGNPERVERIECPDPESLGQCLEASWEGRRPHLLVTDSYRLQSAYYRGLREAYPSVPHFAFDDAGEKAAFPLSGLIHPHPSAGATEPGPTEVLAGSDFVVIREDFLGKERIRGNRVDTLLVAFGGSDPEGQTLRLAGILGKAELPFRSIRLVLGPAFEGESEIRSRVDGDPRFEVLRAPADLVEVMAGAGLAVCGGGAMCYEFLHLGVPVLVIQLADNQREAAEAVARQGCGWNLGRFDRADDAAILEAVREAAASPDRLEAMGGKARTCIDGEGAVRLAAALGDFMERWHGDAFPVEGVLREYEDSSKRGQEFEKLKWGSQEGMINRFRLACESIPWTGIRRWLDIGSGTGAFLLEAEKERTVERFVGLDLSPSLTEYARARRYGSKRVEFRVGNFLEAPGGAGFFPPGSGFDLVTLLGVLQKCGASLRKAIGRAAECLEPGGRLFLTTKNLDWRRFRDPAFLPEADHHWFRFDEVKSALAYAGLEVERMGTFDPRTGEVFADMDASHSLYALARKRAP